MYILDGLGGGGGGGGGADIILLPGGGGGGGAPGGGGTGAPVPDDGNCMSCTIGRDSPSPAEGLIVWRPPAHCKSATAGNIGKVRGTLNCGRSTTAGLYLKSSASTIDILSPSVTVLGACASERLSPN